MFQLKVEKLLSAALKTPIVFLYVFDFCTTFEANGAKQRDSLLQVRLARKADFVNQKVQNGKNTKPGRLLVWMLFSCCASAQHCVTRTMHNVRNNKKIEVWTASFSRSG